MDRTCVLGDIKNCNLRLSELGQMAHDCWLEIPVHFPFVDLDEFIIMPDHVHGILKINNHVNKTAGFVETQDFASLRGNCLHGCNDVDYHNQFGPQSKNLASIIRGFKIGVTKYARRHNVFFVWQERFFDRIIRDATELDHVREYVTDNPLNWEKNRNVF